MKVELSAPDPFYVPLDRELTRSLDGTWRFAPDPDDRGETEAWHRAGVPGRPCPVPAAWQFVFDDLRDYRGPVWYERELTVSSEYAGRRVALVFAGVDYHATVWVNGRLAGTHEDGYLPFAVDVTHLVSFDRPDRITVRAAVPEDQLEIPGDETSGSHRSGIWRPVWMEVTGTTHFCDLFVAPDLECRAGRPAHRHHRARTRDGADRAAAPAGGRPGRHGAHRGAGAGAAGRRRTLLAGGRHRPRHRRSAAVDGRGSAALPAARGPQGGGTDPGRRLPGVRHALDRHRRHPHPPQRSADLPDGRDGPAGHPRQEHLPPRVPRPHRRGDQERGAAGQADGLQLHPQAPPDRRSPLPALGRPAGAAGVRAAALLPADHRGVGPAVAPPGRGVGAQGPQPSVHAHVDAV